MFLTLLIDLFRYLFIYLVAMSRKPCTAGREGKGVSRLEGWRAEQKEHDEELAHSIPLHSVPFTPARHWRWQREEKRREGAGH